MEKSPILNSPYEEPKFHYSTNIQGELDYEDIKPGRRRFEVVRSVIPKKQGAQKQIFDQNQAGGTSENHLINLLRKEVGAWRTEGYPNTTRVTKELLHFWFKNPERHAIKKLFFTQQESIETAVWLNEVASKSPAGPHILNLLKAAQVEVSDHVDQQLPRIAFKMATGTGKTVVMGALILYHFFNRQEYRQDTRFADYFLIVAPGITIRDRLGVLFHNPNSATDSDQADYYHVRGLVPQHLKPVMGNLNSRLVITNYHSFQPKTLQGNKKSPFDGKIVGHDDKGKPIKQTATEDFNLVAKRVLSGFKSGRRLLVLNDEAHHCYLPKAKGKTQDSEADENAKAAVWFTGLTELNKRFKLTSVYDLSATPYYLTGSGYEAYSLFGWVVSDFGLIEAIESGLVKIPFLPESDDSQQIDAPVLSELYHHVKEQLPRKGQKKKKKEARDEGKKLTEAPPNIPDLVKVALDQFYTHYKEYSENLREKGEEAASLFTRPPVFIVVCNNTSVSKEVYKFLAGYEYEQVLVEDEKGKPKKVEKRTKQGHYDLFSNYDEMHRLKKKAPTLLIDSTAIDESDQVDDDFKKIFKSEIKEFKKEYARLHGSGSAEKISDGQILREVVNTVGEPGKLGGHIRCVVSVSMLTEGWDANTVTHIMGLRAFGSQLLCEQVAGRALRRMNYFLQDYDKDGFPTNDKRKSVVQKFPPEYAHIIGVPFKMFKGGTSETPDPPIYHHVSAIKEREHYEITFPNLTGYRIEYPGDELLMDFSDVEDYEIDGSKIPTETDLGTAFEEHKEKLKLEQVLEKREAHIHYILTRALLRHRYSDDDGNPKFEKFARLKEIVAYWYEHKTKLLNITDDNYKKLVFYHDAKTIAQHIDRGINPQANTEEFVKPIFNYYNPFGSSIYVNGNTSKEVFHTRKSHVNYVVKDSGWEAVCAKTLEELDHVECYVKNHFLNFAIPYTKDGQDKQYFPDFIARVRTSNGSMANLMIEVTGMNKDKQEKTWTVRNHWLPAVNSVRDKHGYNSWHFIEIADDIRNIKNELKDKINSLHLEVDQALAST